MVVTWWIQGHILNISRLLTHHITLISCKQFHITHARDVEMNELLLLGICGLAVILEHLN